jgi:hypothetical protein
VVVVVMMMMMIGDDDDGDDDDDDDYDDDDDDTILMKQMTLHWPIGEGKRRNEGVHSRGGLGYGSEQNETSC